MAISSMPKILKDFAVYIDGNRYLGEVSEIELPKISFKTDDQKMGYVGSKVIMGLEAMETTITMSEQTKGIFVAIALPSTLISFKGYQEAGDGANNAVSIEMRGQITEYDLGSVKRGDIPSYKVKMALNDFTYKIDGKSYVEISQALNKVVIGDRNYTKASNDALGLI